MTPEFITAFLIYIFGFISGFVIAKISKNSFDPTNSRSIVFIAITTIWVLSQIVEMINPIYHTSPLVHGLMGLIGGYFFKNVVSKE